jgi:hypothetical protein
MVSNKERAGSAVADTKAKEQELTASIMGDLMGGLGLTYEQAAGVVGNLKHESAFFQAMEEFSENKLGTKGLGWAQWTNIPNKEHLPGGARRTQFEEYARAMGLPTSSYAANFGFLVAELTGKIPNGDPLAAKTAEKLRGAKTAAQAADIFVRQFERPANINKTAKDRMKTAEAVAANKSLRDQLKSFNPPNTPATLGGNKTPPGMTFQRSPGDWTTRQVQQHLSNIGFYDGLVNGNPSAKGFSAAIRDYQKAQGLPGKGTMNEETAWSMFSPTARQTEVQSMNALGRLQDFWAREGIAFPPARTASAKPVVGPLSAPIGRLPADPKQPAMPGGPIGRLPANPNVAAMPGGPRPGVIPAERLARSPITGQQARLSELASMQALEDYRNEPRTVASPPFSGVGRMPMPGEGARLARSPIIGQQARASEIKSLSDLAAMNRQVAEQRSALAQQARASENRSMAGLASIQGAEAARRADLASSSRASENKSMADRAAMDRRVAEDRALYAPFSRAAENKSMRDLASFRNETALGRAAAVRASENKSMRDLSAMRTENLVVRTPQDRAIGSLPAAPNPPSIPNAGLAQGRRASENLSMQNLAMDKAGKFAPGPTASNEASRWNATTGLISGADRRIAELTGKSAAARLADAYGIAGQKSRALDVIKTAAPAPAAGMQSRVVTDPRVGLAPQRNTFNNPLTPAVPAVAPPAAPAPMSYGTPAASRMAGAYAGYAAARGAPLAAQQVAAPQRQAPAPQRQAPVVAQPRQQQQITSEAQYSGRTPGDRAVSASFQPGGIFGATSQAARGGMPGWGG